MCAHAISPKSNSAERLCSANVSKSFRCCNSLPCLETASDVLFLVLCDGALHEL